MATWLAVTLIAAALAVGVAFGAMWRTWCYDGERRERIERAAWLSLWADRNIETYHEVEDFFKRVGVN